MERYGKTAIILGATGLTGNKLLRQLLKDERYEKVKIFTRSRLDLQDSKLEEYLIDLFEMEHFKDIFRADEVFCCVGTTMKKTPDKDQYRKIDFGIPATAAKLCKENEINSFLTISSMGANETSKFFYNRTKGEMEGAVLDMKIRKTHILRPSLIAGKRGESRPMESASKQFMKLVNPFLKGNLKKYQSIHPDEIVKTMIYLANTDYPEIILESDEIKKLAIQ